MKKTSARKKSPIVPEDMRREYRFDYMKAKPNRFAGQMGAGTIAVVLDPERRSGLQVIGIGQCPVTLRDLGATSPLQAISGGNLTTASSGRGTAGLRRGGPVIAQWWFHPPPLKPESLAMQTS